MRVLFRLLGLGLAFFIFVAGPSRAEPSAAAPDARGLAAAARLRRGVNLGNAWEAPPGTWGDLRYGAADFRAIREEGFDHVRIPVAWHFYGGPAPEHRLDEAIFREIDGMVDGARREGLAVILTWHHFDRFTDNPDAAAVAEWHAGWAQIAEHYRRVPAQALMFEALNEPRGAATTARMNELYPGVIAAIRAASPRRTVLVSPGNWGSVAALPGLRLAPGLRNVVVTAHCYEPFLFTHQGASWTGATTATTGVVFPGPAAVPVGPAAGAPEWVGRWMEAYHTTPEATNPCGRAAFAGLIAAAAEWGRREGRPVHLGEFGAFQKADPASRAAYARTMREELDRNGLGWAWWDWKAGFAYARETSPGVFAPDLRAALFPEGAGAAGKSGGRNDHGPRRGK